MKKSIAIGLAGAAMLAGASVIWAQSTPKPTRPATLRELVAAGYRFDPAADGAPAAPASSASTPTSAPKAAPRAAPGNGQQDWNWAALDRYLADTKPTPPPRKLNTFEKWRYDSCREKAAQAPTEIGVKSGMALCKEKYGQ